MKKNVSFEFEGKCAPVAIFVYRRPVQTEQLLDDLRKCELFSNSDIFIFSDGPRSQSAIPDVLAVREVIKRFATSNMTLFSSDTNKGLARSIIDGVTMLCDRYGKVIVLEDDLRISTKLLTWFNIALSTYQHEETVKQISGFAFRGVRQSVRSEAFFLPITTSWGWATWKRSWEEFEESPRNISELKATGTTGREFDLGGAFKARQMLLKQISGEIDSWAIRWYWSVFQRRGLVLYPPESFVRNVGTDRSATHPSALNWLFRVFTLPRPISHELPALPSHVRVSNFALLILKMVLRARIG